MTMKEEPRAEEFPFGPVRSAISDEECAFWDLHAPVVKAWTDEMKSAGDPWWQSAEHAASCLVSNREFAWLSGDAGLDWSDFDVEEFLFFDLGQGGTVGIYGSVRIFFDQLVEAFERFVAAGIIDADKGATWLAQLCGSRSRFLTHYRGWDQQDIVEEHGPQAKLRAQFERDVFGS